MVASDELIFQNRLIGLLILIDMETNQSISTQKTVFLAHRGLKPADVLAEGRPHGTRVRYLGGCRCVDCRQANTSYERERQKARAEGDWNGIVDATLARQHLLCLAENGVGRRAVADVSDVPNTILCDIRAGRKTKIRARTERKILAVTVAMAADHALIDAAPTWKLIGELRAAGFTKSRIAKELNHNSRQLQLGKKKLTVRNAAALRRVHERLMISEEAMIPSKQARRHLSRLMEEYFTVKQVARFVGLPEDDLSFGEKVSVRVASRLKVACAEIGT